MADDLSEVCASLQALQRTRAAYIRSRLMACNNRLAFVARSLGYHAGLDEKQRKALFEQADAIIEQVVAKKLDHATAPFIHAAEVGIAAFAKAQKDTEAEMLPLAERTPAAAWCKEPEQRGFGLLSLAVVVGECGDLRTYANPGKLWKRLGCAPWSYKGVTQMGATWKSKGGLPAEQWSAFGYSPRRRSIAYVIGENLVRQNSVEHAGGGDTPLDTQYGGAAPGAETPRGGASGTATANRVAAAGSSVLAVMKSAKRLTKKTAGGSESGRVAERTPATPGPYRARYDAAKLAVAGKHADYSKQRCHRHAMLLATKLLLKQLWKVWNPSLDRGEWSEQPSAGAATNSLPSKTVPPRTASRKPVNRIAKKARV